MGETTLRKKLTLMMMSWRLELFQVFRVASGVRLNSFELSLLLSLSLSLSLFLSFSHSLFLFHSVGFGFVLMFSIFTLKMAQLCGNLNIIFILTVCGGASI